MIAMDIDRTLLGDDRTVPGANVRAIAAAQQRGITVALCSGRDRLSAASVAKDVGEGFTMIVQNGALTLDAADEILDAQVLPTTAAIRALSVVTNAGISPVICGVHPNSHRIWCHKTEQPDEFFLGFRRKYGNEIIYLNDLAHALQHPVSQLEAFDENQKVERVVDELSQDPDLIGIPNRSGARADSSLLGVYSCGVSKESALARLADHLGIAQEEVLAIGDNFNDMGMVSWAGVGVMVSNGPTEAQTVADWIAPSNNESGVAAAIDRFVDLT